jgi:hypothetical protein
VAAALLLVVIPFSGEEDAGARVKGGSIVEVAIGRDGRSLPFEGQALRPGDRLAFRYTTQMQYFLLVSVEASGKVSVLLPPDGDKSMPVVPGSGVRLEQGIELDTYSGAERFIVLFSQDPLAATSVVESVSSALSHISPEYRQKIDLGDLPFDADQVSWLIEKETP